MKKTELIHLGSRKNIAPESILMLKSDVNYTIIYLEDGSQILSSTTMGIIEKRLAEFHFFRTNRSTIINLDFISNYERNARTGDYLKVVMKNRVEVPLSRRRIDSFMAIMQ